MPCRLNIMQNYKISSGRFTWPAAPAVAHHVHPSWVRRQSIVVGMGRRSDKVADRKTKSNAQKSKLYGRVGKKIVQVVKAGGPDPTSNLKLQDMLRQAKDLGVPLELVNRNIKRASEKGQSDYVEVVYEAYGPGGSGLLVECLTDNLNRSASEVKTLLSKAGCKVAEPGSVMFAFQRCGLIRVTGGSEDAVFEAAMEAGAEDVQPVLPDDGDEAAGSISGFRVYTNAEGFGAVKAALAQAGLAVAEEESGLVYRPSAPVEVDAEALSRCESLLERLLDLDDVDSVYCSVAGLEA